MGRDPACSVGMERRAHDPDTVSTTGEEDTTALIVDSSGRVSLNGQTLGFRFETALLYAFRLHASQRRKGSGTPYIGHLLGVASQVIEAGGDEDSAIAALLHDAVEDQGGEPTLQAIKTLFGERVASIVDHCSDDDPNSTERNAENWEVRKTRYLQSLRHASHDVLRVSLADKLYNARSVLLDLRVLGDEVWGRFNQPKEKQLWYYRELVKAFREATDLGALIVLVEEFESVVREMERLAKA